MIVLEQKSTRDNIIDSSMALFAKKGYKGTTTKMIAKEAGVNELTIFRYFETKEGILRSVFETRLSSIDEEFSSYIKMAEYELVPDLIEMAKLFHEKLMQNIHLVLLIMHEFEESNKLYELYQKIPGELKKSLVAYFDEMQARGKMKSYDSEMAAITFMVMNVGFVLAKQKFSDNLTTINTLEFVETSMATFGESLSI